MSYNITLPLLLSLPILTFVVLLLIRNIRQMFALAIGSNILLLLAALYIFFFKMNSQVFNTQLNFFYHGIKLLPNLSFGFAADGVSMFFIVATAAIGIFSLWYAYITMVAHEGVASAVSPSITSSSADKMTYYFVLGSQFMILASVGFVLSGDVFSFYIFWELTIIPVFFIIGIWGSANRFYHAMSLFIYTAAGTILMLAGVILLYVIYSTNSMTEIAFSPIGRSPSIITGRYIPELALIMITVAFLVKLPIFPLHGWLKGTYTELPTPAVILVAGLIGKLGIYGIYRINLYLFNGSTIMPTATTIIIILAVATVIYGSLVAFSQKDFKPLVAYGSFAHLGVITLGVMAYSSVALEGAIYQVLTHGVAVAGLFILADQGEKLTGSTSMRAVKGLFMNSPRYTFFLVFFGMAFLGLPPMGTFTSELILFIGLFGHVHTAVFLGALSAVLLSAVYVIFLLQNLVFAQESGKQLWGSGVFAKGRRATLPNYYNKFDAEPDVTFISDDNQDITMKVVFMLGVMGLLLLALGLFPSVLMDIIKTNPLSLRELL